MRKLTSFIVCLLCIAIACAVYWNTGTVDGSLDYSSQQYIELDFLESKNAYFYILCITITFPLLFSFEKKVHFYKKWNYLWAPYFFIGIPFIIWDVFFTRWQIWGFNEDYISGLHFFNLPLEEALFFVIIPYACIFIYECVISYGVTGYIHRIARATIWLVGLAAVFFVSTNFTSFYTFTAGVSAIFVLVFSEWMLDRQEKRELHVAIFLCFIPFFIINSLLTGAASDAPIVVYNMSENLGFRIGSIPVDDLLYQTGMLGSMLIMYSIVKNRPRSL